MTCNYSKRQLENGPVSISCTVITFLTAELLPKLEVLGFKCCRLYLPFSRHGTCKLLCDTSLALARSSPTRRYTGHNSYHNHLPLPFSSSHRR